MYVDYIINCLLSFACQPTQFLYLDRVPKCKRCMLRQLQPLSNVLLSWSLSQCRPCTKRTLYLHYQQPLMLISVSPNPFRLSRKITTEPLMAMCAWTIHRHSFKVSSSFEVITAYKHHSHCSFAHPLSTLPLLPLIEDLIIEMCRWRTVSRLPCRTMFLTNPQSPKSLSPLWPRREPGALN